MVWLRICNVTIEALDRFLATGGEARSGEVEYRVVEGSGMTGPDGALLSVSEHILNHFELYRQGAGSRRAQLAEALLIEIFVQLLRDIGSLRLKEKRYDAKAIMIRRAEEYMRARFSEPITIADVAAAAGVDLRSLQICFQGKSGYDPTTMPHVGQA